MTEDYISGTLDGFCVGVCLLLGITLCSNWMQLADRKITPFTRMCGHCILVGCFTFSLFFLNNLWIGSDFIGYLCQAMKALSFICIMLAGICLYTGRHLNWKEIVGIAAPYIIVVTPFLCLYTRLNDSIRFWIMMVAIAQTLYLFFILRKRDKELKNIHSNVEGQQTRWFTLFFTTMIFAPLVWFSVMRYNLLPIWFYNVFNMGVCVVLTWLAFHQQLVDWTQYEKADNSLSQAEWTEKEEPESERSPEEPDRIGKLKEELELLMTEQELFLDADLDINQLVRKLGTNRTYLSNLLNEEMHTTFYDYVNNLRMERAKALLVSSEEKIEDIAQKCGFNSTRSFLRVFKQKVGCTPSAFRGAK